MNFFVLFLFLFLLLFSYDMDKIELELDNVRHFIKLHDTAGEEDYERLRRIRYDDVSLHHNADQIIISFQCKENGFIVFRRIASFCAIVFLIGPHSATFYQNGIPNFDHLDYQLYWSQRKMI